MRAIVSSFAVAFGLLTTFAYAADPPDADPQEELATAIPEAIRLLEEEEYVTFLKNFVPPSDLKKITDKRSIEEVAEGFGEKKAPQLLEVLNSIKDAEPTLDDDEKKATYALKKPLGSKKSISFIKIEKRWYLQN